ncbi:MAG: hypothetical protein ACLGQH_00015, partial [Acidobacteriota bacterium]
DAPAGGVLRAAPGGVLRAAPGGVLRAAPGGVLHVPAGLVLGWRGAGLDASRLERNWGACGAKLRTVFAMQQKNENIFLQCCQDVFYN